jgi:hypothetical protein
VADGWGVSVSVADGWGVSVSVADGSGVSVSVADGSGVEVRVDEAGVVGVDVCSGPSAAVARGKEKINKSPASDRALAGLNRKPLTPSS